MTAFRTTSLYLFVMVWTISLRLLETKHSPGELLRKGGIGDGQQSRDSRRPPGDPKPCKIEECGPCPEGSVIFTPNPPEVDKDLYVNISLTAPVDIWYLTVKGNATMGESFVRRFDENLCDVKKDICPIKKGEKFEFQDHFLLSSLLMRRYLACFHCLVHNPAKKAKERFKPHISHVDWGSSIAVKTTYSAWVELINQDDVHVGCYFMKDCVFV